MIILVKLLNLSSVSITRLTGTSTFSDKHSIWIYSLRKINNKILVLIIYDTEYIKMSDGIATWLELFMYFWIWRLIMWNQRKSAGTVILFKIKLCTFISVRQYEKVLKNTRRIKETKYSVKPSSLVGALTRFLNSVKLI